MIDPDDTPSAEEIQQMALRRSIAEYRAGQVRAVDRVLDALEARHAGACPPNRKD